MTGLPVVLDPAVFGRSLARERAARGWSQRQAAAEAGIGLATLQRAEQGTVSVLLDTAVRLAGAYRTGLDTLLNGEPS